MNFLSHFYFENGNPDDNMVMGVVLPDLVKNAQKESNLYPLKERSLFEADARQFSILKGWEKHVKVDAIFHSSAFFKTQTGILKQLVLPILEGSPVKPFFLAHIGLELILDHLLVLEGSINIDTFYEQLTKTDRQALKSFLENCSVDDTEIFFQVPGQFYFEQIPVKLPKDRKYILRPKPYLYADLGYPFFRSSTYFTN